MNIIAALAARYTLISRPHYIILSLLVRQIIAQVDQIQWCRVLVHNF